MANKVRGQISADFEGEKINLLLSTNAICELEDAADLPIDEFLDKFSEGRKPRMKDLRLLFWALMLGERPKATVEDAGALIDGLSQMPLRPGMLSRESKRRAGSLGLVGAAPHLCRARSGCR